MRDFPHDCGMVDTYVKVTKIGDSQPRVINYQWDGTQWLNGYISTLVRNFVY